MTIKFNKNKTYTLLYQLHKMKIMLYFLIVFCVFNNVLISFGYAEDLHDLNTFINHVRYQMRCGREQALDLIYRITMFTEAIQTEIEYLASSNDNLDIKNQKVNYVINRFFESRSSIVQVSSKYSSKLTNWAVDTYLRRIAKMNRYKYTKVELEFDQSYLGYGAIEKINSHNYEVSVSMWQIFKAYYGDNIAYQDATRKKFRLNINTINDEIRINQVAVAETVDLERFGRIIKSNF